MKILAIETSADETGVCVMEADGIVGNAEFRVLGNALASQIKTHRQFGGIFPAMAKREHSLNLGPLIQAALAEAGMLREGPHELPPEKRERFLNILKREPDLAEHLLGFIERIDIPDIDVISVTQGPGLEPALWVGLNAARAVSYAWNLPLIPTNHLEGHLVASLAKNIDDTSYRIKNFSFPAVVLTVSGGHTELVHMKNWHEYEAIGKTRDDAVGEAFDKVARMLGLPYPGGPEIEKRATKAREQGLKLPIELPRPMMASGDFDFSFSGLKTATLYALNDWKKEHGEELTEETILMFCRAFEEAAFEVLASKARRAVQEYNAQTLVVGGGVSASTTLRTLLSNIIKKKLPHVHLAVSERSISTDNAIMIGMAGAMRAHDARMPEEGHVDLRADGNMKLA